jgi:N4-gp56 family major capsid protein
MQHTYNTVDPRIGKLKGEMLFHAVHKEVLGITGEQKTMPKNKSDTLIARAVIPYGSTAAGFYNNPTVTDTAHQLQEGVHPDPDTINYRDVTMVLKEYGCLYELTSKVVDIYEDDVPSDMKVQTGERMGFVREMIRYGKLKACTNVFYGGGTSRTTVFKPVGPNLLGRVTQSLNSNHAERITGILAPSLNIATKPVEAAWLVFGHTDLEQDFRALPNFITLAEYGSRKPIHSCELGSWQNYRIILSPDLPPYRDSGAAVGNTGLYSTTGTLVDVYPIIITGKNAWSQVALRGLDSIDPTYIPPGQKNQANPLGRFGFVGASFYQTVEITNNGWMAVAEVGRRELVD